MKRKISVLAAGLLAIGLTACGNNNSQVSADATQNIHPCIGCVACGYEGPCVQKVIVFAMDKKYASSIINIVTSL